VAVKAGQAGERVICDACGRGVDVPRFRDLAKLDVALDVVTASPAWDPSRGLLFAGGTLAIVAALAAVSVPTIGASFIARPPDADVIRTAVRASNAVDVHAAWRAIATGGVHRPPTSEEVRVLQFNRSARSVSAVLWAAAGIATAVAVAGGLLVATRRRPPAASP
jgi:hypothetical protein